MFSSVATASAAPCPLPQEPPRQHIPNDDWEATCSIYADLHKQETLVVVNDRGQRDEFTAETFIDIPITAERITFLRPIVPDVTYRVWTLPENQAVLIWRLTFTYEMPPPPDGTEEALPTSAVRVTLLSDYPHSLPLDQASAWQAWLETQLAGVLETDQMSYAACAWMEHFAWDFFPLTHAQNDGYSVRTLDDAGPTHYGISTVVMSFPGPKLVQHSTNGRTQVVRATEVVKEAPAWIHPVVLDRDVWLPEKCPICFDAYLKSDMEQTTCGHYVCRDCLTMYLRVKVDEVYTHRDNPFRCPITNCRQGLNIAKFVQAFLTESLMERVRTWMKDLKHPICHALPQCLSCKRNSTVRKEAIDSAVVYCDACHKRWCEWCLKRVKRHEAHDDKDCNAAVCVQFCERYLAASDRARAKAEARWPWIRTYAPSRLERDGAEAWLKANNGQQCPVCKGAVERSEGCFHMHCTCGAHFCYECGEELFYPFYGTHHCWEERKKTRTDDDQFRLF